MGFYLISTELREAYEPRRCRILRRLRSKLRDDMALVKVHPPMPREIYDTEDEISEIILASRFEGSSLFPISEWPTAVYICRIQSCGEPISDQIDAEKLIIMDWGEIYRFKNDALSTIKQRYS